MRILATGKEPRMWSVPLFAVLCDGGVLGLLVPLNIDFLIWKSPHLSVQRFCKTLYMYHTVENIFDLMVGLKSQMFFAYENM